MASPNCHKGINAEGEVILIQVKWPPGIQLPRPSLTDGDTLSWRLNLYKQPREHKFCSRLYLCCSAAEPVLISYGRDNEAVFTEQNLRHFHSNIDTAGFLTFIVWRSQNDFKS